MQHASLIREQQYNRHVYGSMMVRPSGLPDDEWESWNRDRRAIEAKREDDVIAYRKAQRGQRAKTLAAAALQARANNPPITGHHIEEPTR